MIPRHVRSHARALAAGLAVVLVVAACALNATPTPPARQKLTVGLGFIPSVQFAPFYLADRAGYYREAGLDVTFQNRIDPDLVTLVAKGAIDVGLADGTSVIPAVSQNIPVRYLATVYAQYPSVVFAKASSGIDDPAGLRGKKVGIPGRFGSSWIMLQALLRSEGLSPDDVQIVEYPDFGQGAAVAQGAVDAATGFANNEPVQLALQGEDIVVFRVDEIVALPGPGLIAGPPTIETKTDALGKFVSQTLRAMGEIAADPEKGLEAAIAAVPELGQDRQTQRAILEATIEMWQSDLTRAEGLGAIDPDGWAESIAFLTELKLVAKPVIVDDLVDPRFLPVD
ncbi:MAG TPA: ABC transporter substrate-binding protein [Candidatus Limnocylindrales bacterium]|nr:ABC transporter substrate-binding protein [Candidatus Limnocylindrales bacterium]